MRPRQSVYTPDSDSHYAFERANPGTCCRLVAWAAIMAQLALISGAVFLVAG
jgi:hypothetical protein